MSNPFPNISDASYLAVQEASRQGTPSLHSNNSRLHMGSHSRLDTIIASELASQSNSSHSKPAEQESANRLPEGAAARWQNIIRRVSALPGLLQPDEPEQTNEDPFPPALSNENINPEPTLQDMQQYQGLMANEENLPSMEECYQVSGTEKAETQPNYFTNPFESDNEYQPGTTTPAFVHPSVQLPAQSNDSSVFVNDKYHASLPVDVINDDLPSHKPEELEEKHTVDLHQYDGNGPMPPLRKTNSELQGECMATKLIYRYVMLHFDLMLILSGNIANRARANWGKTFDKVKLVNNINAISKQTKNRLVAPSYPVVPFYPPAFSVPYIAMSRDENERKPVSIILF